MLVILTPYIIFSAVSYCQSPSVILGKSHCGLDYLLQSLDDSKRLQPQLFVFIGNEFDNARRLIFSKVTRQKSSGYQVGLILNIWRYSYALRWH